MSFHPQTPQSPSQSSPAVTDPSLSMTSSMTSITTALPTPAHSVNGSSIPSEMAHDVTMTDDSPQKRKRALDDIGDREQKKAHIEDGRHVIDDLHLDVGEKYLICKTPHRPAQPSLSEDLFERYGLTGLAAEVARVLPNGEKNAIRKTYKGHIKKLGVQGHFDSVKQDPMRPNGLLMMLKYPDDEWMVHHVKGKEIDSGLSADVKAKLLKATTMAKGLVPRNRWDSSVLGEVGPGNAGKAEKQGSVSRTAAPNTPSSTTVGLPRTKPQLSAGLDPTRPKRSIKKRSYGDASFEGYDFPDDDLGQETGYSTGEGETAAGLKRRKKNQQNGQPYPQVRQQSYGPGMVGA